MYIYKRIDLKVYIYTYLINSKYMLFTIMEDMTYQ